MPNATIKALHGLVRELGGSERPGQDQFAEAVDETIESVEQLVARAGTGTGKSLAVLVPAIRSRKKVLVVVSSKALQDQYKFKDAPAVLDHLRRTEGIHATVATLKGKSNFLCQQRLDDLTKEPKLIDDEDLNRAELERVSEWERTTATGEWDQISWNVDPGVKSFLSVNNETCHGRKCPRYESCFAVRARRAAWTADVVITNAAYFGLNVAYGGRLLPPHDVVIVDECQDMPDAVAERLGAELKFGSRHGRETGTLANFANTAAKVLADDKRTARLGMLAAVIRMQLEIREDALQAGQRSNGRRGGSDDGTATLSTPRLPDGLSSIPELAKDFAEAFKLVDAIGDTLDTTPGRTEKLQRDIDVCRRLADSLKESIHRLMNTQPGQVCFTGAERGTQFVRMVDVDIADRLRDYAWTGTLSGKTAGYDVEPDDYEDDYEEEGETNDRSTIGPRAVVMCSGTVPARFAQRTGLDHAREIEVETPFDYQEQARLYLPMHLPSPSYSNRKRWQAEATAEMARLTDAALGTGKGVLMLCTSFAAVDVFADALEGVAAKHAVPVLKDRSKPKNELIAEAKRLGRFVLVASQGFWTGVDLPNLLALVGIDKAPLPTPDDPVAAGLRELYAATGVCDRRDCFINVDVAMAADKLGQAAGRLIRTVTDAGVIAIFDPRLKTTQWGVGLMTQLPPAKRWRKLESCEDFLSKLPVIELLKPAPKDGIVAELKKLLAETPEPVLEAAIDEVAHTMVSGRRLTKRIPVPAGRYAVPDADGVVQLVEVSVSEATGFRFVQRVLEDGELSANMTTEDSVVHLETIDHMGWERCLADYGRHTHRCGAINAAGRVCNLPLSNSESQTLGIGSECRKRLSMAS